MIEMIKPIAALIVRHALTAFGLTEILAKDGGSAVTGAVMVLLGVAWSVWQKRHPKTPLDGGGAAVAILLLPAFLCSGCMANLSKNLKELGDDPAIVVGTVSSVYGTIKLTRIGGTTNSVTVSPDGTVNVNK